MCYRLGLSVGFYAVAAILQPALLPAPAHACGGLFCDSSQPVNQAAERILFVRNADDTITAAIEIKYEGPPERFSWVLPVPGVPDVTVSSTVAFDRLQAATNPQYRLQTTFEDCGDDGRKGGGVPTADSGGSDAGLGPINVLASGSVGPYDYKVISVDESAPDAAQAAVDWLMENNYDLFDNGPELLRPYLEDGLNLIAFRLNKDSDKGAIRPVVLTYASEYPFIPIRPTAVAANEDMGVLVWVAGESRAIARNYKTLELNDALINWWNPGSNYDDVVSAAADEAGGQGFVTELAQASKMLKGVVITEDDVAYWTDMKGSIGKVDDASELLAGTAERFGTWDGFREAVTKFSSLPNDASLDDFLMCPRCNFLPAQFTLDAPGFVDAVQTKVIDPMVETQRLLTSEPFVTRMYTTMSADEMTMDPLFDFNADLPDVSNLHVADTFVHCNGTYRVSLPSGGTLYGSDQGSWPSDELADAELPATRVISQLGPRGDGKVLTDNAAVIDQALEATPSARAYTASDDCGCSVPGVQRRPVAALLVVSMLAFAGGLRRLRRHRDAPSHAANRA